MKSHTCENCNPPQDIAQVLCAINEAYELRGEYERAWQHRPRSAKELIAFAEKRGYRIHSVYVTPEIRVGEGLWLRALLVNADGTARRVMRLGPHWRWSDSPRKKGDKPKPVISPLADKRINRYYIVIKK